jgi:hypothetical protein
MPGAIKCLAAPASKSEDAQKNYRWIVALLDKDPLWAVFPPTRDDSGINYFKDFNYECAAFIWAWYSPAQINAMVRERVLFAVPPKKPQFSGRREWHKRDLDAAGPTIFDAPARTDADIVGHRLI